MQSTLHPDTATVRFNNGATDIQAQAGALNRALFAIAGTLKALKNPGLLAQGNAHAPIADTDDHLVAHRLAGYSNLRLAR